MQIIIGGAAMRMFVGALTICMAPLAAQAQSASFCEEAWLARNMIFDRAGYCFGSPLGQALFDNGNCTTSSPELPADDQQVVTRIRDLETRLGCSVDTAAGPSAALRDVHARYQRLWDIPEPDEFAWACWGYTGGPVALHAGARAESPVIGQLSAGNGVVFEYWSRGEWSYAIVVTGPSGSVLADGWINARLGEETCTTIAG